MKPREYKLVAVKSAKSSVLEENIKLSNSTEIANFLINEVFDKESLEIFESAYVIFFNNNMQVKGYMKLSSGGISMTIIDVRLLFAAALKCLASCIVISHNHPSGNTTPSNEDINITNKIKKGGELLDIKVLDHIILAPNGNYYSFAEWAKI